MVFYTTPTPPNPAPPNSTNLAAAQSDPHRLHPYPQKKESISNHLSPNESFNAWLFWQT